MTLEVRDLRFTYEGWPPTLQGVDLIVAPGECGFLLGPSGGGKTTVLRCIAGLEQSYAGTVKLDGNALEGVPPHRRGVGMIFQEPALFPHLDVWKNVAFGMRYVAKRHADAGRSDAAASDGSHMRYHGIGRPREEEGALEWLRVVGLEEKSHARVDELSGGQRQRVALARTLAARPRAVLLDEPLSALDQPLREELGMRIREVLRRANVPSLWVTHDESEARRLGDRVWRLVEGKAVGA